MLSSLNYKTKVYLLFGAFAAVLIFGYKFSYSDTFALMDEIGSRETKLAWLKEKEKEIPVLKARMEAFEMEFALQDSLPVRDKLTAYISDYAEKNNNLVTEIPNNSFYKSKTLKVQTNTFTIKGSYRSLVLLLDGLEENFRYMSRVMSARFYSIPDPQSKRTSLFLTIITQSFEQKQ